MTKKTRGVSEKLPGSGVWWICYWDAEGRKRRELAGTKSDAIDLYRKRKSEALRGKKLPEKLRRRVVRFAELADDARKHTRANNAGAASDAYRIAKLRKEFGERPAETISISDFRTWFDAQQWADGTYNRVRTVLYSIYRLAIENRKVESNPAKLLKRRKVSDDRVRYLNQYQPLPTKIEHLKPLETEEERLRAVVKADFPGHMEELDVAVNTGMRRSEQYLRIDWSCVDLARKDLAIPQSKNGSGRHIPLNAEARAAFERLRQRRIGDGAIPIANQGPIFVGRDGEQLQGPRHWFDRAVKKAGIEHFSWHCLRHTFGSRLAMAGVDIRTIAELLGHKRIQMTMRYSHLSPSHNLDAVEKIGAPPSGSQNGAQSAGAPK
jgi:integrase